VGRVDELEDRSASTGSGELATRLRSLAGALASLSFVPGTSAGRREEAVLARARRIVGAKLLVELERSFAPPLLALVAGGTNVGKSTLFNAILGEELSSVDPRAAHTVWPVARGPAGSREALAQLLPGCSVLEARAPAGAEIAGAPAGGRERSSEAARDSSESLLFLDERGGRSDALLIIDSPDVDSALRAHHARTDELLIAADELVFVTSPTKYNDKRCVEFLLDAAAMGKRLLVLFNLLPAAQETRREILEDFRRSVLARLPREADSPPVVEFGALAGGLAVGASGGPADAARAHLGRDSARAASVKRAVCSGGARYVAASLRPALRALREQALSLQFVREALDRAGERAAAEYETYLRGLEFLDLELALGRLLDRFRVPVLDDILDIASALPRRLALAVLRRPSLDERRREQAAAVAKKELDLVSRSRVEFARCLEERSTDEVAGKLYRELVTAEYYSRDLAAAWAAGERARAGVREAWLRAFEGEMAARIERSGALRATLKAVRALLELGAGVAAAVLTGGLGTGDLVWTPLATKAAQLAVERLGREYFRAKREEYIDLMRATFAAGLEEVLLGPLRERVPSAPKLEDIEAVEQELRWLARAFPSSRGGEA